MRDQCDHLCTGAVVIERRLYSIEGNSQKLDGGAMFGNAPKPLWERWAAPDDRNRIDLSCRALLIKEPNRWILLETGIGAFFNPKMKDRFGVQEDSHVLLDNSPRSIHPRRHLGRGAQPPRFDHAGGLLTAWQENEAYRLLFPNATYVCRPAWKRARTPTRATRRASC